MSTIILFDVDGTLTLPRKEITSELLDLLYSLKNKYKIGVVGGSDYIKIQEQIKVPLDEIFDYIFCENGLVAYHENKLIGEKNLAKHLGEEKLQKFINFILNYLSNLKLPIKRGTFIELRKGMINISPIGRDCTIEERSAFEEYDHKMHIRKKFVEVLQYTFSDFDLKFSIGGQISFDVFPNGWDKTQCLKYLTNDFDNIYFFGDKTDEGGNDHELFNSKFTKGFKVKNPQETKKLCEKLFL